MITDELNKLIQGQEPQTMDELFASSKEGMMTEQVSKNAQQAFLAMKEQLMADLDGLVDQKAREIIAGLNIRDGRDGKDAMPGKNGKDGKDGSPDKPKEIKDKLETLKGDERLDASAIKNLPEVVKSYSVGKSGGGGSTMRVNDLSSQANGSTRTFTTLNRIGAAHIVLYSAFPTLFLPTTDYTVSGNTITILSSIPAPVAGQSLAIVYESSD